MGVVAGRRLRGELLDLCVGDAGLVERSAYASDNCVRVAVRPRQHDPMSEYLMSFMIITGTYYVR